MSFSLLPLDPYPTTRWTCVRLHLGSKISRRRPMQSIGFHLGGILRELSPSRHFFFGLPWFASLLGRPAR